MKYKAAYVEQQLRQVGNGAFWQRKLEGNRRRDRLVRRVLRHALDYFCPIPTFGDALRVVGAFRF